MQTSPPRLVEKTPDKGRSFIDMNKEFGFQPVTPVSTPSKQLKPKREYLNLRRRQNFPEVTTTPEKKTKSEPEDVSDTATNVSGRSYAVDSAMLRMEPDMGTVESATTTEEGEPLFLDPAEPLPMVPFRHELAFAEAPSLPKSSLGTRSQYTAGSSWISTVPSMRTRDESIASELLPDLPQPAQEPSPEPA